MVRIVHTPPFLKRLRYIYDKPYWHQIKDLYRLFGEHNPTLAYLMLPYGAYVLLFSCGMSYYRLTHELPPAKYFEYVRIMRPDDPAVANINRDKALSLNPTPRNVSKLHITEY